MRILIASVFVLALASCSTPKDELPSLFERQIASINQRPGSPPVLIPSHLETESATLHPTGGPTRGGYDLELAGAPHCGGANACFLADFRGERGGRLTGRHFELSNGDPAVYHEISCGASCTPATIEFEHDGALYSFQSKVGPTTKKALVRLAEEAIAAGPR